MTASTGDDAPPQLAPTGSDAELVVLVDDAGIPFGTAEKAVIHDGDTPLHLAFSCHIFDESGRVLLTRRALTKRTFAGIWTNSFCGHPAPDEALPEAVSRRAARELDLTLAEVHLVLPEFRYRATDATGIVENEICPVFQAVVAGDPTPAPDEVAEWRWVQPADLRVAVEAAPFAFSPWLVLQLAEWHAFGR
ncbi:MAG TPA: isopentenyl-diphosphate Delta-isomerase [Pseudolysinimonas sp.]|nr:isopentenyl-diphosphate Delta-isomerase [Pseudolysinimonas sp.]